MFRTYKDCRQMTHSDLVNELVSVSKQSCEMDMRPAVKNLTDEVLRRLAKLQSVYNDLPCVFCRQDYWTADEACNALSSFLSSLEEP